jgi:hypothetical protein
MKFHLTTGGRIGARTARWNTKKLQIWYIFDGHQMEKKHVAYFMAI